MTARRWNIDGPSPFELERIYDVSPNKKILNEAINNLRNLFPELENATVVEGWAGLIDVTPDAVPIISPVEKIPGLLLGHWVQWSRLWYRPWGRRTGCTYDYWKSE